MMSSSRCTRIPSRVCWQRGMTAISCPHPRRPCPNLALTLFTSRSSRWFATDRYPYECYLETVEPVHRYVPGGYHPVHLGDLLKDGRYRVVHKLGWGGYSTIWAARDQSSGSLVALKISTSKSSDRRPLEVTKTISDAGCEHPGAAHVMQTLDHFTTDGPNGTHDCAVLELLGPSVAEIADQRFADDRLSSELARKVARQFLLGLDFLHQHKIGHADLHTRNVVFTLSDADLANDEGMYRILGKPRSEPVQRPDGKPRGPGMPQYLVGPTSFPVDLHSGSETVKIVDFGQSFLDAHPPTTLHTALSVRAPEVLFNDAFDHRVDLWSAGCLIFELFTGQPPFDVLGITPEILIEEMEDTVDEAIPKRWQEEAHRLLANRNEEKGKSLHEWLEEVYFYEEKKGELSREDLRHLGELVKKMLRYEPSSRASAREILDDQWLK